MIGPPTTGTFAPLVIALAGCGLALWLNLRSYARLWHQTRNAKVPPVTPSLHFGYFGRCGLCAAPLRALTCDVTVATGAVEYATCAQCAELLQHAGVGR